jgi:hypothetical protein
MIDMLKRAMMGDEKYIHKRVDELTTKLSTKADALVMLRYMTENADIITLEEMEECNQLLRCATEAYAHAHAFLAELRNAKISGDAVKRLMVVDMLTKFFMDHLQEAAEKIEAVEDRGGEVRIDTPPQTHCRHPHLDRSKT